MRSTYIKEHSDTVQTIGKKQEPVHLPIETKPNESGLAKRKNVLKKQRIEAGWYFFLFLKTQIMQFLGSVF